MNVHVHHHRSEAGCLPAALAFTLAALIVYAVEYAWMFLLGAAVLVTILAAVGAATDADSPAPAPVLLGEGRGGTVRMTDADRFELAERLRAAGADGRLDIGELEERLAACYRAKTWAQGTVLLEDLGG